MHALSGWVSLKLWGYNLGYVDFEEPDVLLLNNGFRRKYGSCREHHLPEWIPPLVSGAL